MDWISIITLMISFLTVFMVGVELFVNTRQRKIDRQIEVNIDELRRMQQELFKNILGILQISREIQYGKFSKEKNILFHEVLNHKICIWINLNRENSFSKDLRSNCNELSTCVASALEEMNTDTAESSYKKSLESNIQSIWVLIDKYIDEENTIIESISIGSKRNISKKELKNNY